MGSTSPKSFQLMLHTCTVLWTSLSGNTMFSTTETCQQSSMAASFCYVCVRWWRRNPGLQHARRKLYHSAKSQAPPANVVPLTLQLNRVTDKLGTKPEEGCKDNLFYSPLDWGVWTHGSRYANGHDVIIIKRPYRVMKNALVSVVPQQFLFVLNFHLTVAW